MPTLKSTLDALEDRLNQHQQWLSLEPHPTPDGLVQVQITINGHFATLPAEEDPAAAIEAIADFFDGMAAAVTDAAGRAHDQHEKGEKILQSAECSQAS